MSANADDSPVDTSVAFPARGESLESWKAIASYLGRGVTTVQRWEQLEGLPVHRLPHAKKGSVYAVKTELDAWLKARAQLAQPRARAGTESALTEASGAAEHRREWRGRHRLSFASLAALVLLATAFTATRVFRRSASGGVIAAATPLVPRPLANDAAGELCPSLSPDGSRVVYHWSRAVDPGIYVKPVQGGPARRLTSAPAGELFACGFPKWSPTGDWIAFLTGGEAGAKDVWIVSPSGERLRRLTSASGIGLCWAPNGESLGFVDRNSQGEPFSIFSIALRGGQRRRLTTPPPGTFGDTHCAFSPDGRWLAVARFANISQADLYLTRPDEPDERSRQRLTTGFIGIEGLDWSPDGREIVFGSHAGLWRIAASATHGQPIRFAALEGGARHPAFSRAGSTGFAPRLVYGSELRDVNVWRWDVARGRSEKLAPSTWWDDDPAVSPNGHLIAFESNRTGATEIWTVTANGDDARQVTFHEGPVITSPSWSPDGEWIAFSSAVSGNRDIYVVRRDGTRSDRITTAPSEERNPSWSRDGRWLYFRSDRSGVGQIWKMQWPGGAPLRVTIGEGSEAIESPDGRLLYFVRNTHLPGLWSIPVAGGAETFVLPDVREGWWGVADTGIYFLTASATGLSGAGSLRFFDFATATVTTVAAPSTLSRAVQPGFAVSREGTSVFWAQIDAVSRDLMVIDPWQP
jgi:Tol biopolymer transport system component